jgi:hypothetical protein
MMAGRDPLVARRAAEWAHEFSDTGENSLAHQVLMEHPYAPSNSSYAYQKFYEATHSLDSEDLLIDSTC